MNQECLLLTKENLNNKEKYPTCAKTGPNAGQAYGVGRMTKEITPRSRIIFNEIIV
jgi:hypothetical protein